MKRINLLLLSFVLGLTGWAQTPAYDKTYTTENIHLFQTDTDTSYRIAYLTNNNSIIVEYPDHSIEKTVTLQTPGNPCTLCLPWTAIRMIMPSQRTFMPDAGYEFMVQYETYDSITFDQYTFVEVVVEDGHSILDVENGVMGYAFAPKVIQTRIGNLRKTLVFLPVNRGYPQPIEYELYTTEGWINNPTGVLKLKKDINVSGLGDAYPNPSNSEVNIPFKVPSGEEGVLTVLSLDGKIITQHFVDSNSNTLHFDSNEFISGSYLYTLSIDNVIVESKQFVVE